jgi:hypothetical protein
MTGAWRLSVHTSLDITKKKLIIFITELHNKPQSCGASVASAAGPFTTNKKSPEMNDLTHYTLIWEVPVEC